jgi:hypothetical protein
MTDDEVERALATLLPCPFCGAGETQIRLNDQTWLGTRYSEPTSVSLLHHCKQVAGPWRPIEIIGRDLAQAVERWNTRAGNDLR